MRKLETRTIYQLRIYVFHDIVQDVYGVRYDAYAGEVAQGGAIHEDNVFGEPDSYQRYYKGLKEGTYGDIDYEDASFFDLSDEDVVEYWKNHAPTNSSAESTDVFGSHPYEKLNYEGEYAWWQPDVNWVLNDLVNRKEIPPGNYQVLVSW